MTETFKVSLTVKEPMEVVGFFEGETEDSVLSELTPSLIQRWGIDGFVVDSIEIATEDDKAFAAEMAQEQKMGIN